MQVHVGHFPFGGNTGTTATAAAANAARAVDRAELKQHLCSGRGKSLQNANHVPLNVRAIPGPF